jgi:hypothetical protein
MLATRPSLTGSPPIREHHRNVGRSGHRRLWRRGALDRDDHRHWTADHLLRQRRKPVELSLGQPEGECDVAAFLEAGLLEALQDRIDVARIAVGAAKDADHRHLPLRPGAERVGRGAADECDEFATLHQVQTRFVSRSLHDKHARAAGSFQPWRMFADAIEVVN